MTTETGREPGPRTVAGRAAHPGDGTPPDKPRACRECGCTQASACRTPDRPCSWVEPDLCDAPSCLQAAFKAMAEKFGEAVLGATDRASLKKILGREIPRLAGLACVLWVRERETRGLI